MMMLDAPKQPDVFPQLTSDYQCYELAKNTGHYGWLAMVDEGHTVAIHLIVDDWSVSTLIEMKKDREVMKDIARSWGAKSLYAVNTIKDKKWPKFCKLFGFADPVAITWMEV